MAKTKGKVHTEWELLELEHVAPGYMLPRELHAAAELSDGSQVEVDIAVSDGRAVARKVSVETAGGVTAAALRLVPIRDVVATACLDGLQRVKVKPGGVVELVGIGREHVDAVRQIVQKLVGYVEVRP